MKTEIDRKELFTRMKKYNPGFTDERISLFCTILESLITLKGYEYSNIDEESEWILYDSCKTSWSMELQQDLEEFHEKDIDAELCYIMMTELSNVIPKGFKIGYIKFDRAIDDSYSPRIAVSYAGI